MNIRALTFLLSVKYDSCVGQTPESVLVHLKDACKRKLSLNVRSETPIDGGFISILSSNDSPLSSCITAVIHRYDQQQFYTVNIEAALNDDAQSSRKNLTRVIEELKQELTEILGDGVEKIPAIKRGASVFNYYVSSDDRLLEYDFDEVLFDQKSKYQQVKILKSKTLGNALFLDDLQNLAEKDLPYTHGLMNFGKVSYKGKEVLILGGGDGGLLHELLKEDPKFVTMIDIDGVVVEGCKKYLRGACGSVLDALKTSKYNIIIADCIPYLEEYASQGRKFDVIFNDLTDIPLQDDANDSNSKDVWALIKKILPLAFQCLCKNGKYMNHAIGSGCAQALETYENTLKSLPTKVEFTRHEAFVPSFLEEWVFYDITKLE